MSNKKVTQRRNILKGFTIVTAWTAPVVHSVVIPAHATTSNEAGPQCDPLSVDAFSISCGGDSISTRFFIDESQECPRLAIAAPSLETTASIISIALTEQTLGSGSRLAAIVSLKEGGNGTTVVNAVETCADQNGTRADESGLATVRGTRDGIYSARFVMSFVTGTSITINSTIFV